MTFNSLENEKVYIDNTEAAEMVLFLDPENIWTKKFLDLENRRNGAISGSRDRRKSLFSGSGIHRNGQQILNTK